MTTTSAAATDTPDDRGVSQGAWMELVRRARIGTEHKLALLVLGSYANADGTKVHPGVARLAAECEVSYRTAGRYLAWAREVGFIELVKRSNRRRGLADEYRLTLGPELLQRVTIPDPGTHRKRIGEIMDANRTDSKRRQRTGRDRKGAPSTDITTDRRTGEYWEGDLRPQGDRRNGVFEEGSTDMSVSVGTGFYRHEAPVSTDTPGVLPPFMDHLTSKNNLPWEPTPGRNARYYTAQARASDKEGSLTKISRIPGPTCEACCAELDPDGSCFMCRDRPGPPPSGRPAGV